MEETQVTYTSYTVFPGGYYWYNNPGYPDWWYPYGYYYYPQLFSYCPYCGKKLEPHVCGNEVE